MSERVLAGDVGGTNLRLAVVELGVGSAPRVVARHAVQVAGLADPADAILAALDAAPEPRPRRACLGVAGVAGRRIEGVNLPWALDADVLEQRSGLERVELINDFHAAAAGVPLLGPDGLLCLNAGDPRPDAPRAVLGAGTGLGQAFLPRGGAWQVIGTEGGHRDFAPTSALQDRLLGWLRARHGRVSTERVLSGPGLLATYRFLVEAEGLAPSQAVDGAPPAAQAAEVSRAALAGGDGACAAALRLFVAVYGAEAGNVALTVLARGGVYLAGGIAPQVLAEPELQRAFLAAFRHKGRFSPLLEQIPVHVVLDGDLGLPGAAAVAAE